MNHFFLIVFSITYGLFFGLLYQLTSKKYFFITISFIMATLIYIFIIYNINNGKINYILKISLICGFILYNKCKIYLKKCKYLKNTI